MSDYSEHQIRQLEQNSDSRRTIRDVLSGVSVGALGSYAAFDLLERSSVVTYELLVQVVLVAIAAVASVWAVRNSMRVDQDDEAHFDYVMRLLDDGDERMQQLNLNGDKPGGDQH